MLALVSITIIVSLMALVGFFSLKKENKKERQLEKCKFKISYTEKLIPIGMTHVELTMEDGRIFNTAVYGRFEQNIIKGNEDFFCRNQVKREPSVSDYFNDSLVSARDFISRIGHYGESNMPYIDDNENINKVVVGKVISARILETEEYEKMFSVAVIEENK